MNALMASSSAHAQDPLEAVPVERVMHVGFVGCSLDAPLRLAARLMAEHRVHCLVGFGDLAEDDVRLWGVVSDLDVVSALACGRERATAGEIGSVEVITVRPSDTVRRAAELMRDHDVAHLLVVDDDADRPLGVISTLDVMALAAGGRPPDPA